MKFTPLHVHSHFSLLDGLSKPEQIAERCVQLNVNCCALTDHGSISGIISFIKALRDVCKNCGKQKPKHQSGKCKDGKDFESANILPITGLETYVSSSPATHQSKENKDLLHQVILARNLDGWLNLVQLVSRSNDPDVFYYKPRVDLDIMAEFCDNNMISFSGHPGSILYDIAFRSEDCLKKSDDYLNKMWDIFGRENFFIEIQLVDTRPEVLKVVQKLREIANRYDITPIATCDAHYATPDQAEDHKILLCSSLKTTLPKVKQQIEDNQDFGLMGFFKGDRFHIPSVEEMLSYGHAEQEIQNTQVVSDMCEPYDVFNSPQLPKFKWTEGLSEKDYLLKLCREGWKKKHNEKWDKQEYGERVKSELSVINGANLAGYFLIVQDIIRYAKSQNILCGPGRGSVAGSLVAYLLDITNINSIKHGLIFERFYNAGRNTKDRISLPDIDIDVPMSARDNIIDYLKSKYGDNNVANIVTFSKLIGRGSLKEVLRAHHACDFGTMNEISKTLPHEHEIIVKLEEAGQESVINYVLRHDPGLIKDYCSKDFKGEYGRFFEQASRIEGTIKSQGKHAAGLIISDENLNKKCPMVRSKDGGKDVGFDMYSSEDIGLVKFDLLTVLVLDKLMGVNNLLQYGRINNETT